MLATWKLYWLTEDQLQWPPQIFRGNQCTCEMVGVSLCVWRSYESMKVKSTLKSRLTFRDRRRTALDIKVQRLSLPLAFGIAAFFVWYQPGLSFPWFYSWSAPFQLPSFALQIKKVGVRWGLVFVIQLLFPRWQLIRIPAVAVVCLATTESIRSFFLFLGEGFAGLFPLLCFNIYSRYCLCHPEQPDLV